MFLQIEYTAMITVDMPCLGMTKEQFEALRESDVGKYDSILDEAYADARLKIASNDIDSSELTLFDAFDE